MAAGDLIIGAKTIQSLNNSTSSGTIAVTGDYWYGTVITSEKKYDRRRIAYPGIPGFDVKDYGSRGRSFSAQLFLISTSVSAVVARLNTLRSAFQGALNDITTPESESLTNCELEALPIGLIYRLLDGKYGMVTTIQMAEME